MNARRRTAHVHAVVSAWIHVDNAVGFQFNCPKIHSDSDSDSDSVWDRSVTFAVSLLAAAAAATIVFD